jgi:Cu/Zn superoxide dismutase
MNERSPVSFLVALALVASVVLGAVAGGAPGVLARWLDAAQPQAEVDDREATSMPRAIILTPTPTTTAPTQPSPTARPPTTATMTPHELTTRAPGVTPPVTAEEQAVATAEIISISGEMMGTARFTEERGAVRVRVEVAGFDPVAGYHRVAVTAQGRCDPPDFESAGEEVAVLSRLPFSREGGARHEEVTLALEWRALQVPEGRALVIYADHREEPGERIACGVIRAP